MSYSSIDLINPIVSRIIGELKSQKSKDEIYFPKELKQFKDIIYGKKEETPFKYLNRILDSGIYEKIERCKISDKLIVFIEIRHKNNYLSKLTVQCFVTENMDIEDAILDESQQGKVFYYRLDYDLNAIGPIFKESLPHLHIMPSGNPRINVSDIYDDMIVNFIEFIYINHFYEEWMKWIEMIIGNNLKEDLSYVKRYYNESSINKFQDSDFDIIRNVKNKIKIVKENYYFWKSSEEMNRRLTY